MSLDDRIATARAGLDKLNFAIESEANLLNNITQRDLFEIKILHSYATHLKKLDPLLTTNYYKVIEGSMILLRRQKNSIGPVEKRRNTDSSRIIMSCGGYLFCATSLPSFGLPKNARGTKVLMQHIFSLNGSSILRAYNFNLTSLYKSRIEEIYEIFTEISGIDQKEVDKIGRRERGNNSAICYYVGYSLAFTALIWFLLGLLFLVIVTNYFGTNGFLVWFGVLISLITSGIYFQKKSDLGFNLFIKNEIKSIPV